MSYHKRMINKGVLGKSSKIQEEVEELLDAEEQANKVLAICELSDLYGAIEEYLIMNHPSITMEDLKEMAHATKRAFLSGSR